MPLGKIHQLLCTVCRIPVTTEYSYPENRCGHTTTVDRAEDAKLIHVSCTNASGNKDCRRGVHYDKFVQLKFKARDTLKAANDGQTNRA